MKILIIDDNDLLLRAAVRYLLRCGHEVQSATNGTDGLRLALELRPDRIICDFDMPGLDGLEVYEQLPPVLQERLYLWSGTAPEVFPRPVISKPCNVFELMSIAGIV